MARTRGLWEKRAGRTLTDEDARAISENCLGFIKVLIDWARAETASSSTPAAGSTGEGGGGE